MGTLFVVSTPIGHLEDITLRALHVLAAVDLIAAEDTRHSRKLLQHYEISTPLVSLHEHNEKARIDELLARLSAGQTLALISDAGTPTLSDPGYLLVRAVAEAGFKVVAIPGASAMLAALASSGLASDRFLFLGFPPRKTGGRQDLLKSLSEEPGTLVFYESPKRTAALLRDVSQVLGDDRNVVVARELTKLHETIWRGTVADAISHFDQEVRGEIVLLVEGAQAGKEPPLPAAEYKDLVSALLDSGMAVGDAARRLAAISGTSRRQLYKLGVQIQAQESDF